MTTLEDWQWLDIRKLLADPKVNITFIAKHYKISKVAIYSMFKRKGWALRGKQPQKSLYNRIKDWFAFLSGGKRRLVGVKNSY